MYSCLKIETLYFNYRKNDLKIETLYFNYRKNEESNPQSDYNGLIIATSLC